MDILSGSLLDLLVPALALLVAGIVKGTIGIGLPTTALGIMTIVMAPRVAIAYLLVPMLVSNAWQVHRAGQAKQTALRYLPFAVALVIGVWVTIYLTYDVSDRILFGVLGGAIVVFVLINVTAWAPYIPDHLARPMQYILGAIAGVLGGLTSVWAPPMVIYLTARKVPMAEFVRASGLLIFIGSVPLAAGYFAQGLVDIQTFGASVALLVPTFAGFVIGERFRGRADEVTLRRILLAVFFLMGLNLIRRSVFG
jgi:uncharacterized membrane protein YfcA